MSNFIKQCKGLDIDKVNILDDEIFYSSVKLDGIYIQVHKKNNIVSFFTSSGKKFLCNLDKEFLKFDFDFIVETEYICNGGKLGTRAIADNEIKKVVKDNSFLLSGKFKIFDVLNTQLTFKDRYYKYSNKFGSMFCNNELISFKDAKEKLKDNYKNSMEGLFLKRDIHINIAGKRTKDAIKLKHKLTADLFCVGWKGDYIILKDDDNRVVNVLAKNLQKYININDVIEIEYEQIIKTYVNAKFKCIRHDKKHL